MVVGASVIYLVVSIFALRLHRWAIAPSIAVPLIFAIWWDTVEVINCSMYFTGHELYRDSPATILVVLIYVWAFAVPANLLSILFYLRRTDILKVLRPTA